ncbi:MAG: mechanosensitive ion channel family protein [Planctomycetes bacterium]|nr:mechanosensitive ion channel family protein [Planctomycetota bacterium]
MDIFNTVNLQAVMANGIIQSSLRVIALVICCWVSYKLLPKLFYKISKSYLSDHVRKLTSKSLSYSIFVIFIILILNELGFKLTALLGTAGVVGIAIGLASQTSLSNIICGLFLVSERPFKINDIIQIGDKTGIVLSIDLISVKLRTFDNKFIRIPNEMIFKTQVTNITEFPIRRLNIKLGVAYKENIREVIELLKRIVDGNVYCLDEPTPIVFFDNFGDSALEIFVGVWIRNDDYLKVKETLLIDIKERFDSENIEIPFPHISLYSGSETEPFPITHQPKK